MIDQDQQEMRKEETQVPPQKKKKRIIDSLYAAILSLVFLFIVGIIFYMQVEKWRFVDAFYFVGVTLTTIGYGDIHPVTDLGRIFTVFFAFTGVGITLLILSIAAEHYLARRVEQIVRTAPDKKIIEFTKGFTRKIADGLLPEQIKPKYMQKNCKDKQK